MRADPDAECNRADALVTFCTPKSTRLRAFICGKLSNSGAAATIAVRIVPVAAQRPARRVARRIAGCAEGQKLAGDLHATLRVGVDDHAQRAVEVVVLFGGEVV